MYALKARAVALKIRIECGELSSGELARYYFNNRCIIVQSGLDYHDTYCGLSQALAHAEAGDCAASVAAASLAACRGLHHFLQDARTRNYSRMSNGTPARRTHNAA